jgi:hypothetical protein
VHARTDSRQSLIDVRDDLTTCTNHQADCGWSDAIRKTAGQERFTVDCLARVCERSDFDVRSIEFTP